MICQIKTVKTKTQELPRFGTITLKVSAAQPNPKRQEKQGDESTFWSPITPGPFTVPITRWIE